MARWHGTSKRKPSGGRKVHARKKRSTEISTEKQHAYVGARKQKVYRRTGGNALTRVLADEFVNVSDASKGTTSKASIKTVTENASNPNFVRRNILVRGAVVETDLGMVRITSRPGKDGVINGTLIDS